MIELSRFDSPVGILTVAIGPRGLRALALGGRMPKLLPSPTRETTTTPDIAAAHWARDIAA